MSHAGFVAAGILDEDLDEKSEDQCHIRAAVQPCTQLWR